MIRRHPLAAFFVLSYLYSWAYWLPIASSRSEVSHFPGLLGPMLAAFTVTLITEGWSGTRGLLARMIRWRVPARWYLAALVPVIAGGVGVAAAALSGAGWPTLAELRTLPGLPRAGLLVVLVLVFVINGYGEEVGWRGYAWPKLRERLGPVRAAAILASVWAGWHIPTFWLPTGLQDLDRYVIPGWIIGLMAGALVLGWLYESAKSSLLIVTMFHTSLNVASATLATEGIPAAVTTATVIVWAVLIAIGLRRTGRWLEGSRAGRSAE